MRTISGDVRAQSVVMTRFGIVQVVEEEDKEVPQRALRREWHLSSWPS